MNNITILSQDELHELASALRWAHEQGHKVSVAIDEEGFKFKVANLTWSPGIGTAQ